MTDFGTTAIGASDDNPSNNWVWCKATSLPSNGTLTAIQARCTIRSAAPTVNYALYSDSAGAPGILLVEGASPVIVPAGTTWVSQALEYTLVDGTQYWFGIAVPNWNGAIDQDIDVKYDTNGGLTEGYYKSAGGPPGAWPDTTGLTALTNERWSIYGTYTIIDAPPPGTHIVTGRGSFAIDAPAWISTSIDGIDGSFASGQAEPPNWYHVGMLRWGTANGAMLAYPVTGELDLVQLPSGMTELHYEFRAGITATIVELATP